MDFPLCGDYVEPKLTTIADKKAQLKKPFVINEKINELSKVNPYDGLYEQASAEDILSNNEIVRQKVKFIRDGR